MATHRVYGSVREAGQPVARTVRVYSDASGDLLGTAISDTVTGAWEILLDSDALVHVHGVPGAGYPNKFVGPVRPVPL